MKATKMSNRSVEFLMRFISTIPLCLIFRHGPAILYFLMSFSEKKDTSVNTNAPEIINATVLLSRSTFHLSTNIESVANDGINDTTKANCGVIINCRVCPLILNIINKRAITVIRIFIIFSVRFY